MKKKQRQMIGMLLALVVLAATFLGIRQYNKNASSATSTTEDTQETVLDVNSDDITSFRYVYEGVSTWPAQIPRGLGVVRPMPLKKRMIPGTMQTIIP